MYPLWKFRRERGRSWEQRTGKQLRLDTELRVREGRQMFPLMRSSVAPPTRSQSPVDLLLWIRRASGSHNWTLNRQEIAPRRAAMSSQALALHLVSILVFLPLQTFADDKKKSALAAEAIEFRQLPGLMEQSLIFCIIYHTSQS